MRILKRPLAVLILVTLAANTMLVAQARQTPHQPSLDGALTQAGKPTDRLRVIVRYKRGASARVRARMSGKVDRIMRDHRGIHALVVEMRRSKLAELCVRDADVDGCSEDAVVSAGSEQ